MKPKERDDLILYLAASAKAMSSVLVREENGTQLSVYYVSKALLPAKSRYTDMEKLAFSLMIASRKLRPHFEAHNIQLLTNLPLKQVLRKPDALCRLMK